MSLDIRLSSGTAAATAMGTAVVAGGGMIIASRTGWRERGETAPSLSCIKEGCGVGVLRLEFGIPPAVVTRSVRPIPSAPFALRPVSSAAMRRTKGDLRNLTRRNVRRARRKRRLTVLSWLGSKTLVGAGDRLGKHTDDASYCAGCQAGFWTAGIWGTRQPGSFSGPPQSTRAPSPSSRQRGCSLRTVKIAGHGRCSARARR